MKTWTSREARARLSELVTRAQRGQKQVITRRGKKVAIIVAYDDFVRQESSQDFKDFLVSAPLHELDLRRPYHRPRKMRL
jgi:prevent-host-death family protein